MLIWFCSRYLALPFTNTHTQILYWIFLPGLQLSDPRPDEWRRFEQTLKGQFGHGGASLPGEEETRDDA